MLKASTTAASARVDWHCWLHPACQFCQRASSTAQSQLGNNHSMFALLPLLVSVRRGLSMMTKQGCQYGKAGIAVTLLKSNSKCQTLRCKDSAKACPRTCIVCDSHGLSTLTWQIARVNTVESRLSGMVAAGLKAGNPPPPPPPIPQHTHTHTEGGGGSQSWDLGVTRPVSVLGPAAEWSQQSGAGAWPTAAAPPSWRCA